MLGFIGLKFEFRPDISGNIKQNMQCLSNIPRKMSCNSQCQSNIVQCLSNITHNITNIAQVTSNIVQCWSDIAHNIADISKKTL